jgi:hypothetical protein
MGVKISGMTEYLRDLLYLDWEKAASIFSQLQGGLLKETQESAEKARERRAGLGLSIGPLRPEVGGSAADRASVVETRVMHHDLLRMERPKRREPLRSSAGTSGQRAGLRSKTTSTSTACPQAS